MAGVMKKTNLVQNITRVAYHFIYKLFYHFP